MREIKFRAWNPVDMEMIADPLVYDDVGINDNFENFKDDEYYLMQYTGLKDKNGNPIFEGDIIKYDRRDGFEYDKFVWVASVGQNIDGSYEMQCKQVESDEGLIDIDWRIYPYNNNMEIIGNIYENQELLEAK